jgi:hypothetical protein
MKRIYLVATGFVLCFGFAPTIGHAKTVTARPFQGSYEKSPQAAKTFSGVVMKQGDVYILSDKADKTNYQLVDSKKVGDFLGKNVKVTGTLDAENLTIQVQNIQEIA